MLSCQTFHFAYKIQQNFTIWNGVETLEITSIFNGVARTFSYTQSWVSEWGRNLKISPKKGCFLSFEWQKTNFTTFGQHLKNIWKNPLVVPPGKNPSEAHAHKHVKLPHFCKNLCCITSSVNTIQQHQFGKQAIAGLHSGNGVFCQTITKSCEIHCKSQKILPTTNNINKIQPKFCNIFSLNNLAYINNGKKHHNCVT